MEERLPMDDGIKIGFGVLLGVVLVFLLIGCCCILLSFSWVGLISMATMGEGPMSTLLPYQPHGYPLPEGPMPTAQPVSMAAEYNQIRVSIVDLDQSYEYLDLYGSRIETPPGSKYLWIEIQVENDGQTPVNAPYAEDFAIIQHGIQYERDYYNESADHPAYWGGTVFPAAAIRGWLLFNIPAEAGKEELTLAFAPSEAFPAQYFSWSLIEQ
jgi:hypothetical protein